ncbi:hypothetical protein AC578_10615 [Pseudocercospora eumusae]|uniref:Uncharacterized protein n=1 Tax=Pseudocercospora eumusae TaxID=321146 RepID=A0A139HKQ0_9PEZI|nr:hypothetical protein AC578_10615 [Pseudocercospora eumusae]
MQRYRRQLDLDGVMVQHFVQMGMSEEVVDERSSRVVILGTRGTVPSTKYQAQASLSRANVTNRPAPPPSPTTLLHCPSHKGSLPPCIALFIPESAPWPQQPPKPDLIPWLRTYAASAKAILGIVAERKDSASTEQARLRRQHSRRHQPTANWRPIWLDDPATGMSRPRKHQQQHLR